MNRSSIAVGVVSILALAIVGVGVWTLNSPAPLPAPASEPAPRPGHKAHPLSGGSGSLIRGFKKRGIAKRGQKPLDQLKVETLASVPSGPVPDGPDLIFITWDTVRTDHCSTYGFSRETTPGLTALGATGLVFDGFIVPQATTLPSHVSMFTGTHPEEHGIIGNSIGDDRFIPPDDLPTIAGHLSAQGYRTAGFVSSTPLKKHSGIHAGFQVWGEPTFTDRVGPKTTDAVLQWARREPSANADRPLFLWVHYFDAHAPYLNPPGTESLFIKPLGTWITERKFEQIERSKEAHPIESRLRAYDRELFVVDQETTRLLKGLESRGRDRVVVIAGDHGEGLGQHSHLEHGLLWTEQLASPLVITAPGLKPQRLSTLTAAKDLLPTVMALADFPAEAELLAMSSGRDVLASPEQPVFSRTSIRQTRDDLRRGGGYATAWSYTTPSHTFMLTEHGVATLYDRAADPHQQTDIAAAHPALVARLTADVEAQRAVHAERHTQFGAGRTEPMGDDVIESLEALGYIDK